jgi:maltooligosyltrehalose trehalohydrolase
METADVVEALDGPPGRQRTKETGPPVMTTQTAMAGHAADIGPTLLPGGGVRFRVWAPDCTSVDVELLSNNGNSTFHALDAEEDGYFVGIHPDAAIGDLYRYRLNGEVSCPDPASRFQPQGVHGPSQIVSSVFPWTDGGWRGLKRQGQVLYELHIGTFTPRGTWRSAAAELQGLAQLGVTAVEVMPVAEFPGRFGWGYDGVYQFAPSHLYGTPEDFRHFVDHAHACGLGVLLDVVYNHFGPVGNYLKSFSTEYFTKKYRNEWAEAINFDGPQSQAVRDFFKANAGYWAAEFHLDGLRLDATQQVFDASPVHILREVASTFRKSAQGRATLIVAENESQEARLARPSYSGGFGLDALWNDDFHHAARVALTARNEAYYSDFRGAPQEFVSAAKYGYLFQGQRYAWQNQPRGTPAWGLGAENFISYIENHDQVANSSRGARLAELASPGLLRAFTALLLLGPATPMLFQGQEFGSRRPFNFFADMSADTGDVVRKGRREFLSQFPSIGATELADNLPNPLDVATFEACVLDRARDSCAAILTLHKELLAIRATDLILRGESRESIDGAVLSDRAFVLRYFGKGGDDRLLLLNMGLDLHISAISEPLLAPPCQRGWNRILSTEDPRYGGAGTPPVLQDGHWHLPGRSAIYLAATERVNEAADQTSTEAT